MPIGQPDRLADFLSQNDSLAVLCGAGVSTASGIPDYRDRDGRKKHAEPIQYQVAVKRKDAANKILHGVVTSSTQASGFGEMLSKAMMHPPNAIFV